MATTAVRTSSVTDAEILAALNGDRRVNLRSLRRGITSRDPGRITIGRQALAWSLRDLDYPGPLMTTVLDACERAIRAELED